MKYILILFISFHFLGASAQNPLLSASHHKKHLLTEEDAVAEVRNLYETKDFLRNANKSELPMVISDGLNDSGTRIRVKVGYSRSMFRSMLIFDVDIRTAKIYYEDFEDESGLAEIPLGWWRRWRNDPVFKKLHTFKHGELVAVKQ